MRDKKLAVVRAVAMAVILLFTMASTAYADESENPEPTTNGEPDGTTCLITVSLSPDWAKPNEEVRLSVQVCDSSRHPYANKPLTIKMDGETFLDDTSPITDQDGKYQTSFNAPEGYGTHEITVIVELDNGFYSKSINLTVDLNPEENQQIRVKDDTNNRVAPYFALDGIGIFASAGIVCIGIVVSGLYLLNRRRK